MHTWSKEGGEVSGGLLEGVGAVGHDLNGDV